MRFTLMAFIALTTACFAADDDLKLPPGFRGELIYSVPKDSQGSWISMTHDPKGRLIASDQNGPLYRITPGATPAETNVEKLNLALGHAHGLCYAKDSLFAVVNGSPGEGRPAGLYRALSHDGGETFDPPQLLLELKNRNGGVAAGEHGPHGIRVAPDGTLYLIAGNFTQIPDHLAPDSSAKNWNEELLLPRMTDHLDATTLAPGGWVATSNDDGKTWRLMCVGLRNAYDLDFTDDGEPITFDSDMEWDVGAPWYRPTRITHLVSGGEYGWRNGSAKWRDDYPDTLPPIANVGLASPTGVTFGRGLKFPAKWQQAFYMADWAYGRIFAATLAPRGSSYSATVELFASKRPFPVTSLVVNTDGALYAVTGGRNVQSEVWRFTYNGSETTPPKTAPISCFPLRASLEHFHGRVDPAAVDVAWPCLSNSDPYLRYAARIAIESQPVAKWQERALAERDIPAAANALVALARCGDKSLQPRILDRLNTLLASTGEHDLLALLRACELCFIRMGEPSPALGGELAKTLNAIDRKKYPLELCQLLAYLRDENLVAKTIPLLATASPEDQLGYATTLRLVKVGWTIDARRAFFEWLNHADAHLVGAFNLPLFLEQIRKDAIATLTNSEKRQLGSLINVPTKTTAVTEKPRRFVKHWTYDELRPLLDKPQRGRSFENGKSAFESASCLRCHRFGEAGGDVGPLLSWVGNRMSGAEILESIVKPSKVISDQYAATRFIMKSGDVIEGRVEKEDDSTITVRTSPFTPATSTLAIADIRKRSLSPLSPMPEGLIDTLTADDILDMLAFIRSASNPNDEAFHK
jgi:putative heme-binding domain-containing protein